MSKLAVIAECKNYSWNSTDGL